MKLVHETDTDATLHVLPVNCALGWLNDVCVHSLQSILRNKAHFSIVVRLTAASDHGPTCNMVAERIG